MLLNLEHIGQIALAVADVDRAETFYKDTLGLRKLYRFGELTFFDCAGVRLMIEKAQAPADVAKSSVIYFRCADIALVSRFRSSHAFAAHSYANFGIKGH